MTKRRDLNVLSFECVIFLFYVDVNRKFLRRKTNVNVKLFFITFFEFYTSYSFFILEKIFIVVENMIQIFMTFASWRERKIFRFETNMQMKTLLITRFSFCVNASFFEKSLYLSTTWLFENSSYLLITWWKNLDKTDCVHNFILWTK
jgi:hypothetical protein